MAEWETSKFPTTDETDGNAAGNTALLSRLQNENNSCPSGKVTNLKKPLGCFLFRVGDDDSGPEDIMDDEDLECEKPLRPKSVR